MALASTIGVFGSSQIAFAAGTADVAEPPAIISPAAGNTSTTIDKPIESVDVVKAPDKSTETGDSKGEANAGTGTEAGMATAPEGNGDAGTNDVSIGTDDITGAADALTASALALDSAEADTADGGISLMDAHSDIVDEESLMNAIADGNTSITLHASFTISKPIPVADGDIFSLTLADHTLTCTGSAFQATGSATIVVIGGGSGTLNASGSLVSTTSGSKISFTQISGTVSASTISNFASNWSYSIMGGTLSLSRTLEMGAESSLIVNGGTTFSSTASGSAVHLAASTATFKIDGKFTAANNGVSMDPGTKLPISNNAVVSTGGNAIVAGSNCDVVIGRGSKITAGGKVMSISGSSSTGTSVESGPNVSLSDGTIAMFMGPGTVVEFDHDKFVTVACANPQSMNWYGAIDSVWCPTQADFDALLKMIPNGHEECTRYTVTFHGEDGSSVGTVSVRKGHCIGDSFTPGAPEAPGIAGKKFTCWKDGSGKSYDSAALANEAVNGDTTYTAQYAEDTSGTSGSETTNPDPIGSGNTNGSGDSGNASNGGSKGFGTRAPRVPTRTSGWLPNDLAMAAGFPVPTSEPDIIVINELGAGAGADGDNLGEDPVPEASLYDVQADGGFSFDGPAVARVIALSCGVVLAAVLAARVAGGFAASAKASRRKRRNALGLD